MAIGPEIIQGIGLPPVENNTVQEATQAPALQVGSYKLPTVILLALALAILFGLLALGFTFGATVRVGA